MESPSYGNAEPGELRLFLVAIVVGLVLLVVFVNRSAPKPVVATPDPASASSKAPALVPAQMTPEQKRQYEGDYISHPDAATKRIDVLAKQARGDYESLSQDDQQWLDSVTGGHGRDMMYGRYDALVAKEKAAKRRGQAKIEPDN